MNSRRALQHRERGSILSLTAISLTAILLAVGLAVDVGHWYLVGGELQNAADAAALAAASALDANAGGITQAVDRALATVNKYEFNHTPATITRADVRFAATLDTFENSAGWSEEEARQGGVTATIRFVKVTVPPKSVGVFFSVLATKSATIRLSRSAVAGHSVQLNRFGNIVPLALVENRHDAVNAPPLVSPNCGATGLQFARGCQYVVQTLRDNDTPVGGTAMMLDLRSRSGNSVRERLGLGSDGYVTAGQSLKRLTSGVTQAQVSEGLNVRFERYAANLTAAIYPPDANITQGIFHHQYKSPAHLTAPVNPGVWDRRVIVVPISTPDEFDAAARTITPRKFGAFFLTAMADQANLYVEYIGTPTVIGNGGFDPTGAAGAAGITTAVLYR